jgi:3'-phosphoadenosine 5'-phosphosulfate sulfotransferase (PAPS reductase)/FAD synthetase
MRKLIVSVLILTAVPAYAQWKTNPDGSRYKNEFLRGGKLHATAILKDGKTIEETGRWWKRGKKRCLRYDHWTPDKNWCS